MRTDPGCTENPLPERGRKSQQTRGSCSIGNGVPKTIVFGTVVPMRAALYARVSTTDRQKSETQLRKLREYAKRREFDVAGEWTDRARTSSHLTRRDLG